MLPKEKNKMNMRILGMLREQGAPFMTPFPGEQDFESTDLDLDQMGDVLLAKSDKVQPKLPMPKPKKKKKKIFPSDHTPEEEEAALEFVPADESVQIGGVN